MNRALAKHVVLSVLILSLTGAQVLGVPASPRTLTLKNRDGTTLQGRMFGDEYLSWVEDLQGYSLAFDRRQGFWAYAQKGPDGRLIPTGHRAGVDDPDASGFLMHLRPSADARQRALESRPNRLLAPVHAVRAPVVSGDIPNLVILARFANQTTSHSAAEFEEVFNGDTGSVKDFWLEMSNGRINLVSTIVDWIDLPHEDAYYAWNDQFEDGRPWEMLTYAIEYLGDRGFDFTRYDTNQDGEMDAVCLIHSGPGYENSADPDHLHSHFDELTAYGADFYTHDNIHITRYHTEPELRYDGVQVTQIGVVAHETGHFFGLPDLYDYDADSSGVGIWGLMAYGAWCGPDDDGTVPCHLSAWSKVQLGLVQPVRLDANQQGVRLPPVLTEHTVVRLDAGMPAGQYFLLENRQQIHYDSWLPGSGLLIYHVDDNIETNDDQDHYLVDVEQADGLRQLNTDWDNIGDAGDPWPNEEQTAFLPTSVPGTLAYGRDASLIGVYHIARDGADVVFDVAVDGLIDLGEDDSPGCGCSNSNPRSASGIWILFSGLLLTCLRRMRQS